MRRHLTHQEVNTVFLFQFLSCHCFTTNAIHEDPALIISSNPDDFLVKVHLLIPLHWGIGFQHVNLGGTQIFSL